MQSRNRRSRSRLDPITDRLRSYKAPGASKLPGVILFIAIVAAFPLAYGIQWLTGASMLVSAFGAVAIAAAAVVGAVMLIRT